MRHMKKKWNNLTIFIIVLTLCMGSSVNAAEKEIELDSDEKVDYIENEDITAELDQYEDGIYNITGVARSGITGVIRLGQSKTKVLASYSTSYTHEVDRIGVKNVILQYKSSLKLWYNIITLDNRYCTKDSLYSGSFTTIGTIGRTYRLKATHYITENGSTQTSSNITGEMTFMKLSD